MQDMERDQDLNQNFFSDDNFDHEQKFILKKAIKSVVTRITAPKKLINKFSNEHILQLFKMYGF